MKNLKLHTPPLYTAATAVYPYSPTLDKHFIVETKYSDPVCLARKVGEYLHVPRELAPLAADDRRSKGHPIAVKCLFDFKADNYEVQKGLFDTSMALLQNGKSHVLQATMGIGKSFLGTRLACELGVTTLIIVTKEDLMIQWKQNILKYTDCKEEDIGIIQQDVCQVKGKKFVIGMVHSVSNIEYPSYVYDYFGLVITDETHRVSANYFVGAMFKFNSYLRLGLSATPKRPDGKAFVFHAHIGEVGSMSKAIHLSPKVLVVETNWKLPKWRVTDKITGVSQMIDMPHQPGKIAHVVKAMAKDDDRNHLIADLALKAYNKDRRIVIFFDQLDHIAAVMKILVQVGIPANELSKYVGGMSDAARKNATTKRILLATYIYMSEGTDVPHLDTAILASPRSNIMQSAGRILRAHEGKKEPVIIDIVDTCSKVLVNAHHSRMRQYNELKANIVKFS